MLQTERVVEGLQDKIKQYDEIEVSVFRSENNIYFGWLVNGVLLHKQRLINKSQYFFIAIKSLSLIELEVK